GRTALPPGRQPWRPPRGRGVRTRPGRGSGTGPAGYPPAWRVAGRWRSCVSVTKEVWWPAATTAGLRRQPPISSIAPWHASAPNPLPGVPVAHGQRIGKRAAQGLERLLGLLQFAKALGAGHHHGGAVAAQAGIEQADIARALQLGAGLLREVRVRREAGLDPTAASVDRAHVPEQQVGG